MYPTSNEVALLQQLETERAIADLVEIALEIWLPLAQDAVLQAAAEPPPDPTAAADTEAQWDYLIDALVLYGISIIAAHVFDTAYRAITGVQLAAGGAFIPLLTLNMFDMPTRSDLHARAAAVLRRRLRIDAEVVYARANSVPQIQTFIQEHVHSIRGRVMDVVGRVFRRTEQVVREAPPEQARAQTDPVFDPLDPQWQAAVDTVAQTQATGVLNDAVSEASRQAAADSGRQLEVQWVAILDTHTRLGHAEADGQRQPLGVPFEVDGEPLRFPGDPRGSLDNIVNCRCRLFAYFTSPALEASAGIPYIFGGDDVDSLGFMSMIQSVVSDSTDSEFNWVEECGGLPRFIKRISKHLREKGMPESQAIATAVNACKKMCATGDTNFPGRQSVNKMSRAQACAAVAEWEKLKACAARKRATDSGDGKKSKAAIMASGGNQFRSFTGVLAVIGSPTDDGRMFAPDIELTFRDFPLPLLWQRQSSGGHMDAFTVGVIQSAAVLGTEVIGKGYMLNTPEATEAMTQIEHKVTGPSVDLGDVEWELRDINGNPISEQDWQSSPEMEVVQTVLSAKVLATTLVSTPAFGQTSITLGDMVDVGDDALVAAAAMPAPGTIDAQVYPASFFTDPEFSTPTRPHITEEGRILGHLAVFDVCHIGIQDSCVRAPRSHTGYAWFHTSPPVKTDDGGKVQVGRLTVGCGHAGPRMGANSTIAHYDDTGTCFALVHVGEDAHGIWFSGVPAPGATPKQVLEGISAPLSGDWRNVGGNLELVAALAVNTPGFPIIASGATDAHDEPLALVASLGPCAEERISDELLRPGIELAREIVAEWRAAEKRETVAQELVTREVRRQASELISKVVV